MEISCRESRCRNYASSFFSSDSTEDALGISSLIAIQRSNQTFEVAGSNNFAGKWPTLPGVTPSASLCFCFPTHQAAQSRADLFDRMLFRFAQQLGVTSPARFHFLNKLAREFS